MTPEQAFQRIVFLIGAGASKNAGCKLSRDMLSGLSEAIQALRPTDNPDYVDFKEVFKEIYQFIYASLLYQNTLKSTPPNTDLINIEDFVMILNQLIDKEFIVPYPLVGNWNDKILKWEIAHKEIFKAFRKFILLQLIRVWTKFDISEAQKILEPIRYFLATPDDVLLRFFSLNYDLVFESTFNSPEITLVETGFSEKEDSSDRTKYWAAAFDNSLSLTKINLYKLHGSIDWEYDSSSEGISIKEDIYDGNDPLIIFGSFSKMLSFDPFLYMLSKFRDSLENASVLVVIGYSFHDKYINNLIIQQLSKNTSEDMPKKLLIVGPGLKGKSAEEFTQMLQEIQESKSVNDVINFVRLSPERVKLIGLDAAEFYKMYFADGARLLINEVEELEKGETTF